MPSGSAPGDEPKRLQGGGAEAGAGEEAPEESRDPPMVAADAVSMSVTTMVDNGVVRSGLNGATGDVLASITRLFRNALAQHEHAAQQLRAAIEALA